MAEVIYCNQCKYYDGVHNYPGKAPCTFWGDRSVMWTECCDKGELYYKWECLGIANDVNKLHELLTLTDPNPEIYTPNGDCYILYNRATNEVVFTDKEGV